MAERRGEIKLRSRVANSRAIGIIDGRLSRTTLRGRIGHGAARLDQRWYDVAACGRGDVDPRVPLGARIVGARPVVLRGAAPGKTIAIPSTASLPPATYTADQAQLGRQIYESTCARCHPPGQLDGETFEVGWNERRVFDLFSLATGYG